MIGSCQLDEGDVNRELASPGDGPTMVEAVVCKEAVVYKAVL